MELTDALKKWAVENLDMAADASDDEYKAAITGAISAGTLTARKYAELMAEDPDVKEELGKLLAQANAPVIAGLGKVADAVGSLAEKIQAGPPKTTLESTVETSMASAGEGADDIDGKIERQVEKMLAEKNQNGNGERADFAAAFMAKAAMGGSNPRVKAEVDKYSTQRKSLVCPEFIGAGKRHPLAGEPAVRFNHAMEAPSEADFAICGAFAKFQLLRGTVGPTACEALLTEHERKLVLHALHEMRWTGVVGVMGGQEARIDLSGTEVDDRKLTPPERKAILDDTTSGGTYAVPRVFDEAISAAPILFGELAPLVDMQNLVRGAVVDGSTWTDPSFISQTEGSAFSLVSTASLIGNLDTSIFNTVAGIELGLDWESDTPINFGTYIVQRLGMKLKEWLDEQIAIGDGTTEPTGIFTASGVNTSNSSNSTGGPFTLGDFEKLAFGLTKAMRASNPRSNVYVTSDYMYRQARGVPVHTTDARRLLGMDHSAYTILEHPCKIQDSIANGSIAFANLAYYRMYRRLGIQIRNVIEGQTLALKNTRLIIVRARYGGQPTLGVSINKMTDGPTSYGN
jgi:HK97 family phage major capsid protein